MESGGGVSDKEIEIGIPTTATRSADTGGAGGIERIANIFETGVVCGLVGSTNVDSRIRGSADAGNIEIAIDIKFGGGGGGTDTDVAVGINTHSFGVGC
ncbi:MAG: hypothetical protein UT14_C0033G0021 [Candidatus Shapirobacteria bacterium GW2011_GWE1_38_92]|uniref:Uncharacterized protein n=1 Tax=Candidatus Shapirobacteria bacterium GW2011_GWE1_38_92 TaxID=1618489 RepID=A0A0G0PMY2_9BACT|nr:MAG: hypothetical protein UT14_C0033G0021 [Candidatus Shapirobacteria bacterium GW2011_GWE1_38_92]